MVIWKTNIIRSFKGGDSMTQIAWRYRSNFTYPNGRMMSVDDRINKVENIIRDWMTDRRRAIRP